MSKLTINNVTMRLSHCSKIINFNRNLHKQNNSNAIKTKKSICTPNIHVYISR